MKKKIIGFVATVFTITSITVTAFAYPSISWYTSITGGGSTASGITSCSTAELVEANLTANYSGGQKTAYAAGRVAASAVAHIESPLMFYNASTQHRVDVYYDGFLNTFRNGTSDWN